MGFSKFRVSAFLIAVTVAMCCGGQVFAQLPTAGTHFTFGVIEGADKSSVVTSLQIKTDIWLYIVGTTSGCGVLTSPSGYVQTFQYDSANGTAIQLDRKLMHLDDMGKTKKGLIVTTSEPVNLTIHDYAESAGDATQILPDSALDTSYVVASWGLFNDKTAFENNRVEFLVTAKDDSTKVTITPSVTDLLGEAANVPFTVTLNAGECYMVKADTLSQPISSSLSGSRIHSSKPVSVITGITCGYIPSGIESCNELMDQLIGKKWWGKHFFVQPLGNLDSMIALVITSDRNFTALINGFANASTKSRIITTFSGPSEITTTVPVQVHQFTRGNWEARGGISDPTMVTILDTSLYADTLAWLTPAFNFYNWAPIVFPTGNESRILLDGQPLSTYGTSFQFSSSMAGINVSMQRGTHFLTSPVPVSALVTGFELADAYSFIAGGVGQMIRKGIVHHTLLIQSEAAMACANFGVTLSLDSALMYSENATSMSIRVNYDPALSKFVRVEPHALLIGTTYSVDSSTLGKVTIAVQGNPLISGSDIARVVLFGAKASASTTLAPTLDIVACSDRNEVLAANTVVFPIAENNLTLGRAPVLQITGGASTCLPTTLHVLTDAIVKPGDQLTPISIEFIFDTTGQRFTIATAGALISGLAHTESGASSGKYLYKITNPQLVSGSDTLLNVSLTPRVAKPGMKVHARISFLLCNDTVTKDLDVAYDVARTIDSARTKIGVTTGTVSYGDPAAADVTITGIPATASVSQFDLFVTYNHNLLSYTKSDLTGTLASGWTVSMVAPVNSITDKITFTSTGSTLGTSGTLAHLFFNTYVSDSSSTPISVTSSLASSGVCPLSYNSPQATALFMGKDLCGDNTVRRLLLGQPLSIERVDAGIAEVMAARQGAAQISIIDIMGNQVRNLSSDLYPGLNRVAIPTESLSGGTYILRIQSGNVVRSRSFQVTR